MPGLYFVAREITVDHLVAVRAETPDAEGRRANREDRHRVVQKRRRDDRRLRYEQLGRNDRRAHPRRGRSTVGLEKSRRDGATHSNTASKR